MAENKGVLPGKLHSFLEVRLNIDIEFCPNTTISNLFKSITPYYCFLNTTLLGNIIDEFLGEPLQQQLDEYEGLLEEFTSSTKISLLKEIDLKTAAQHKGMPLVVLKLSGRCLDVTIKRFQELVKCIFAEKSETLSNIHVKDGCICITWNTREFAVPSLITQARKKVKFMNLVGILKLSVGEVIVFEQPTGTEDEWKEDKFSLENYLVHSVISNCTEAVEFLLNAGADPSYQTTYEGNTVPGLASLNRIAKLHAGANVDQEGLNCFTPLILACKEGHRETVDLLLQSGVDPNLQTDTGLTALLSVDYNGSSSLDIVRSLLQAGAAVNTRDSNGWSSLAIACEYGCYKIAELLIQYGADVQLGTFDGHTPLMTACHNGHEDIVALLLNSQANPNIYIQQYRNQTVLMLACKKQHANIVSLLLSSGADPNLQSESGWTALMFSFTVNEYDECIPALLISAGANPNLQAKTGCTALMFAARYHVSGVRVLLNAQAHVNAQDHAGHTALHYSTIFSNLATTELLLSAGADPSIVNTAGKTAVDLALDSQYDEVCQLLLSHTGNRSAIQQQQVDPPLDTAQTSSSLVSTTPHYELDQLHFALHHPLPPAGTTKHDVDDLSDDNEEY